MVWGCILNTENLLKTDWTLSAKTDFKSVQDWKQVQEATNIEGTFLNVPLESFKVTAQNNVTKTD